MSKNIDISLIGDWSSNETKKLVSTKTDQEYKNKSHSSMCLSFKKDQLCYGCALNEHNGGKKHSVSRKCKFFLSKKEEMLQEEPPF